MHRVTVPEGFEASWSTERQLWWRDIDALGHLNAVSYAYLYQEACGDFIVEAWADPDASYVVARMDIRYLREIRLHESPVRVYVRVDRVGRSGFDAAMVICSASGNVCSTVAASLAAWNRERHRSREMTLAERDGLVALGGQHLVGVRDA
jgi:acyl-CoA thioester hydrolase